MTQDDLDPEGIWLRDPVLLPLLKERIVLACQSPALTQPGKQNPVGCSRRTLTWGMGVQRMVQPRCSAISKASWRSRTAGV